MRGKSTAKNNLHEIPITNALLFYLFLRTLKRNFPKRKE